MDEAAVRNTQDVDILVRRQDLGAVRRALEDARFVLCHAAGIDMSLDGPDAKARDAVHVVIAGEKVRPDYLLPAPEVSESETATTIRVLNLDALVRMKLTSFRRKDQVHLLDLMGVGLIDESWAPRFPPKLAARLCELLQNPDG